MIWCLFHPRVTAVVCKRPQSFCQKCRWQVAAKHAYTLDPIKSSGNTRSQSSQLTEPLWMDPGLKSGISLPELISTFKKKAPAGNKWSNILQKSSQARKKAATHPPTVLPLPVLLKKVPANIGVVPPFCTTAPACSLLLMPLPTSFSGFVSNVCVVPPSVSP